MLRLAVVLVALTACARAGDGVANTADAPPGTVDAPPNTQDDAPPDCQQQTYWRDADKDGHGDPARPMMACTMPADHVANMTDCDDTTADRKPGNMELCDGLDNDCNAATNDTCPLNCTPARRPAPDNQRVYLICNGYGGSWTEVQTFCTMHGYKVVQIESAAENTYVRGLANSGHGGVNIWVGANDRTTENAWVWDGGDQFWQGTAGGAPVGGRYSNWAGGEPNDDGTEDCAEMRTNGQWNDLECGEFKYIICRR